MRTGVQFTGTLGPGASSRWFSAGWNPAHHVVWTVMPTTPRHGGPALTWTVEVERHDTATCTYWIKVTNLTSSSMTFEGRYAILNDEEGGTPDSRR